MRPVELLFKKTAVIDWVQSWVSWEGQSSFKNGVTSRQINEKC